MTTFMSENSDDDLPARTGSAGTSACAPGTATPAAAARASTGSACAAGSGVVGASATAACAYSARRVHSGRASIASSRAACGLDAADNAAPRLASRAACGLCLRRASRKPSPAASWGRIELIRD